MAGWTCPDCKRQFGQRNQSHGCAPALTLEAYFATAPDFERPIFEAVLAHIEGIGPLVIEAVQVGILVKRQRTFAELRPKRDRIVLSLLLSRPLWHPRIVKSWHGSGQRIACFVDLRSPDDVDDDVRDWLTEAYFSSAVT